MLSDECKLIDQPEQSVLSIRTTIAVQDMPAVLGRAYAEIMEQLEALGEYPAGTPFVAYYNLDMQALDIEIGFPTSRRLPGKGIVQPSLIPAGPAATCEYTGPYEDMEPAYNALNVWIAERGYEPNGVCYEYYLNGPEDSPPSGYKTRIVFPLKINAGLESLVQKLTSPKPEAKQTGQRHLWRMVFSSPQI